MDTLISMDFNHHLRKGVSIQNNFQNLSNPKFFKEGCCDRGDVCTDSIKGWECLDYLKWLLYF
jgi:hypothetical protein